MSSPSNKPYKSRLLNLINRYYIKFQSQVNVKFRELGYVIQGGVQKAVLPFFWLFQSGKKIGQVFSAASSSTSALPGDNQHDISSSHYSADRLIEIVHQNITSNPLFSSLFPAKFQGLASRIKNKSIVIVLNKNKVKHLIPKIKQNHIKFIINKTIEDNPKLVANSAGKNNNLLSISPIKWLKKIPTNDSKTSFNYSQNEAKLAIQKHNKLINNVDNFLSQFELLITKNNSTNNLEKEIKSNLTNRNINSHQKSQNNLSLIKNEVVKDIIETSNHKLQEVLPIVRETTAKIVVKGVEQIQVVASQFNKSIEEDPFQIRILIAEAINYFFYQQKHKGINSTISNKFLNSFGNIEVMKINQQTNEPWLSWEDLYGIQKSLPVDNIVNISQLKDQDETANYTIEITPELINSLHVESKEEKDLVNDTIHITKLIDSNEITTKAIANLPTHSMKESKSNLLNQVHHIPTSTANNIIKKEALQETLISDKEEAIEAKVIEIKYEKHLLEIILEKLDQIILWLEEIIIKIITIFQVFISSFKNNKN